MKEINKVVGNPGCGKTHYLTSKITEVLNNGANPESILVLSYSKAAAQEIGSRNPKVDCRTIHSLCHAVYTDSAGQIEVISQNNADQFNKLTPFELYIDDVDIETTLTSEAQSITREAERIYSYSRNCKISIEEAARKINTTIAGANAMSKNFAMVYEKFKEAAGIVDFTDMLERSITLIGSCQLDLIKNLEYLIIDEGQDLTPLQWDVVHKLTEKANDVTLAGDPDQALYTWGGAEPHGMSLFVDKWAGLANIKKTLLNKSFRVPKLPLTLAGKIIGQIPSRKPSIIKPLKKLGSVQFTSNLNNLGIKPTDDTLVIGRTIGQLKELSSSLRSNYIPFIMTGHTKIVTSPIMTPTFKAYLTIDKIINGIDCSEFDLSRLMTFTSKDILEVIKKQGLKVWYEAPLPSADSQIKNELYGIYKTWGITPIDMIHTKVNLRTIHASKGLEADHVVVHTGSSMKIRMSDAKSLDDEARTFFVAVTRTRDRLSIITDGVADVPRAMANAIYEA